MSERATTLQELARRRREDDRPTNVHVVGDFDQDPPKGIATAKRVAHLLVDDGTVRDEGYDELDDGDVAFVRIDDPMRDWSFEKCQIYELRRQEIYELVSVSRVKMLGGIVVFTERIDAWTERLLDARVWAKTGGVDRVERLDVHPIDPFEVNTTEIGWS